MHASRNTKLQVTTPGPNRGAAPWADNLEREEDGPIPEQLGYT